MSIVRQDFRSKLSGEKGESMNTVLEKIRKMGIVYGAVFVQKSVPAFRRDGTGGRFRVVTVLKLNDIRGF